MANELYYKNGAATASEQPVAESSVTNDDVVDLVANNTGINTGDEDNASIIAKRPLKTVGGQSLEGSGDISIPAQGVQSVTGDGVGGTPEDIVMSFPSSSEITEDTDKKFVTDSDLVTLSNTSGTNTGDETTSTIQTKRPLKNINGQSIEGTGNISTNETSVSDLSTLLSALENNDINVINIEKSFEITGLSFGSTVLNVNSDKVIKGFSLIFGSNSSIFFRSNQDVDVKVYCDIVVGSLASDACFCQDPNYNSNKTNIFFRNILNSNFFIIGVNSVYELANNPSSVEDIPAGSPAPQQFWDNTFRNENTSIPVATDSVLGGVYFKDDTASSTLTISTSPIS